VPPLSSTNKGRSVNRAALSTCKSSKLGDFRTTAPRGEPASCATTVRHTVVSEPSLNRSAEKTFGSAACSTTLYHNGDAPISATTAPKPSGNGHFQPSQRSPSAPRKRTSGLFVRGEIWYLRLRVPQHLQAQIGR
jgi:hypothetical protein